MKNSFIGCSVLFLLTLLLRTDLYAQPFVEINAGIIGLNVGSAAWGDYDNDGDLDILINGWDGAEEYSIVYRNDNGSFVDINAGLIPAAYGSAVAWGDYDNDGDLDILLSGRIDNVNRVTNIYRNDNGNFIDINAGLLGLSGSSIAWGDYNNDGDLDIVMTGWDGSGRNAKIYRNDSGIFIDINVNLIGVTLGTVAWGDYDNDGDLDILLTGLDDALLWNAKVYRNDNGTFTDINANLEEVDGSSASWGDYDSDGDLDIVLSGRTSFGVYSRIYRNENGNFININANIVDVYESSSVWGDYDNDGDFDLLLCGYDYSTVYSNIYRNDNGNFVNINAGLIGIQNRNGAVWGDYDNDGDLDILLTGDTGSGFITKIYRNDNTTTNTIPNSPSNFASTQTGIDEITLSWSKSSDNETPQNALTYNLRIGSSPGGADILSPMSNLNDGFRKVPSLGNTNHDTSWTINNLAEGNYYWSVQTIDNSFAGSNFANEQIITVIIPVELTSFTAQLNNNQVLLQWETATETNNKGFEIERRLSENTWERIGFVEGHGTTTEVQSYQYVDNVYSLNSNSFAYRLKQIDYDGSYEYSNEVEVEITMPLKYELTQNYPNPFNPSTAIKFSIPEAGSVELKVYDLIGNEVATLVNETKTPGIYEVKFRAIELSSGVYIYSLKAGNFVQTKKMILIK